MKRETFGSRLGFILVSAGCAVGIGNVWKFPYMCGQFGVPVEERSKMRNPYSSSRFFSALLTLGCAAYSCFAAADTDPHFMMATRYRSSVIFMNPSTLFAVVTVL